MKNFVVDPVFAKAEKFDSKHDESKEEIINMKDVEIADLGKNKSDAAAETVPKDCEENLKMKDKETEYKDESIKV